MPSKELLTLNFILIFILFLNFDLGGTRADLNIVELPWNLQQIDIARAWNITQGSEDIAVAVIDTGVDFSHPALVSSQWINNREIANNSIDDDNNGYIDDYSGWDWVNSDNNPGWQFDDEIHHHGTFIAGIIAANNSEVVGIAPKVKIMPLRVVDEAKLIPNPQGLENSVEYAVKNNASVIIMSLDLLIGPPGFRDSLRSAISANIPIIGVAGNSDYGNESIVLPGRFPEVIAVGASNPNKEKADYSNIGEEIEILAPGGQQGIGQIRSTSIQGGYRVGFGTSYAAPHVAGVVGLIKSIRNDLSVEDIRSILHSSAQDLNDVGWDQETGFGLLNASAALELTQVYETIIATTTTRPPGLFGISFTSHFGFILVLMLITLFFRRKRRISS